MKRIKTCMTPISNALSEPGMLTDNLLAESIDELSLFSIISKKGVKKRSGDDLKSVMFSLLIRSLLGVRSIKCFCGKFIGNVEKRRPLL